ncbi:23235_t:CDS:2 [Racocetra persica]|uniref:23235_t:CDS:1 n=1 Tax=Racocetra persica TaxID=160502 RepID=A0ACA9KC48_9GLOM|nr:23235_t:CDS:2 [Racocetra persica]
MSADTKQEREVSIKAVLRSECDNYLYEYLNLRVEQASFTKEIQAEHSSYYVLLHRLENDRELEFNAKSALDAFETEKKSSKVTNFWKEVKRLEEEENAVRSASLGHLNIFGKSLSQYANVRETTILSTNCCKLGEQRELQESSHAEFDIIRTENHNISIASSSQKPENQNYYKEQKKSDYNKLLVDNNDTITNGTDNYLQKAVESMIGKVESDVLKVDDVDLEVIFEKYRGECDNEFDDIMDMRPTSLLTKIIPEVTWEKFIRDTYPDYGLPEKWEESILSFFKPKGTLDEWEKAWRGLFDEKESSRDLWCNVVIVFILFSIETFKAPFNILKSGDLEENQYNSQFVNPILKCTLKAICDMDWRILEVPIRSSKFRRNSNINPFVDRVLSAKRADGLARMWKNQEEIFIYEQTGPQDIDDVTDFYVHDYKLVRTMRYVLNQRIILRLNNGIKDYNNLASFGALGHRNEVSLLWCTIHTKSYCLREYESFYIPAIWEDLPVLSEAIIACLKFFTFIKSNIAKIESRSDPKIKLLSKRKVHIVTPNPQTPDRSKKQIDRSKKQKK